ncbi:MAG: hypothetical protein AB8C95_02405 [Phycisphaeraceae bacterium]
MKHFYTAIQNLVPQRLRDDQGATMLEWCLLLAAVVIPAWVIIRMGLATLAGHYGLVTTINQMPFP